MISISRAIGRETVQSYYRQSYTMGDYYTQDAVLRGHWFGIEADELGLIGETNPRDFDRIMSGRLPDARFDPEDLDGWNREQSRYVIRDNATQQIQAEVHAGKDGWISTHDPEHRYRTSQAARNAAHRDLIGQAVYYRKAEKQRAAWDIVSRPGKTVSIACVVGGDKRILDAHRKANTAMLRAMQELIQARGGGDKPNITTGRFVVARFEHYTARPEDVLKDTGETVLYPAALLHTHNVMANWTRDAEGKIRSINPEEMFKFQGIGKAVYQSVMAHELRGLGYQVVYGKNGSPEIAGYTEEYVASESLRRKSIERELAATGFEGARAADIVAKMSRNEKLDLTEEEVAVLHRANAAAHGNQSERIIADAIERAKTYEHSHSISAEDAVTKAKRSLAERYSVFEHWDLVKAALEYGQGHIQKDEIEQNIRTRTQTPEQVERGELAEFMIAHHVREGAPGIRYTTDIQYSCETELCERMAEGRGTMVPIVTAVHTEAEARHTIISKDLFDTLTDLASLGSQLRDEIAKAEMRIRQPQPIRNTRPAPEVAPDIADRLREMHRIAADFYHGNLAGAPSIAQYIASRGIDDQTTNAFRLGYADRSGRLMKLLSPYGRDLMVQSGLFGESDSGRLYERFRDRLMFPIEHDGNIIAFGGRLMNGDGPKYLNSPETPIYRKSAVLYSGHIVAVRTGPTVLVEGYFDALAVHAAGLRVASVCGTRLTREHAEELKARGVTSVVLSLDPDAAGIKATTGSIRTLVAAGIDVKILSLPDGLDPDEHIKKHGSSTYAQLVNEAQPWHQWLMQQSLRPAMTPWDRIDAFRDVLDSVAYMPRGKDRVAIAQQVADAFDLCLDSERQHLRSKAAALSKEESALRADSAAAIRDRLTTKMRVAECFSSQQGVVPNPDQISAAHDILTSPDRITGLVGSAGAGKTTVLRTIQQIAQEQGYRIVGVAPTSKAVEKMEQNGIKSTTLQAFLLANTPEAVRRTQQTVHKCERRLDSLADRKDKATDRERAAAASLRVAVQAIANIERSIAYTEAKLSARRPCRSIAALMRREKQRGYYASRLIVLRQKLTKCHEWKEWAGKRVETNGQRVRDLEHQIGLTTDRLTTTKKQAYDRGVSLDWTPRLIFADESSLAGNRQCAELFRMTQGQDRIVLVGDPGQHESIEASRAFDLLLQAGMRRGELYEIVRQNNPVIKEAVEKCTLGKHHRGFDVLKKNGYVIEMPKRADRLACLTDLLMAHPQESLVIVPDNRTRLELNELIRAQWKEKGWLQSDKIVGVVLVSKQELTAVDRETAAKYQDGNVILFRNGSDHHGIAKGTYWSVASVNVDANTISVYRAEVDGTIQKRTLDPALLRGNVEVYDKQEREFAVGDRVLFKKRWAEHAIVNGTAGTVAAVDADTITVRLTRDGSLVSWQMPRGELGQFVHLDHGYATTSYSVQGDTARYTYAHFDTADKSAKNLLTRAMAYVSWSRPTDDLKIVTNDSEKVRRILQQTQDKAMALSPETRYEYLPEQYKKGHGQSIGISA